MPKSSTLRKTGPVSDPRHPVDQAFIDAYGNGKTSVPEIARSLDMSVVTAYATLNRMGLPSPKALQILRLRKRIVRAYRGRRRLQAVAHKLGVSFGTVQYQLQQHIGLHEWGDLPRPESLPELKLARALSAHSELKSKPRTLSRKTGLSLIKVNEYLERIKP